MLTDHAARSAKPKDKPHKLSDGRGMHLLVTPTGGKLWRISYRHGGKQKTLALGVYPDAPLARACEKRDEARRLLADGIDPAARKKAEKAARAITFRAVAAEFVVQREAGWAPTHGAAGKARIERFNASFGGAPIGSIQAPDVPEVLRVFEAAGQHETAKRLRAVAGQVFRFAVQSGRAVLDPTAALRGTLAPAKGGHHAAVVGPRAFGDLLRAIDTYAGEPVTRAALRLLPLVFTRPGELRNAEWTEIDMGGGQWAIPARRGLDVAAPATKLGDERASRAILRSVGS